MEKYSDAEVADINTREKQGLEALKALNLTPAAVIQKYKVPNLDGFDVFADRMIPYLADTKYDKTPIKSPIQKEDLDVPPKEI